MSIHVVKYGRNKFDYNNKFKEYMVFDTMLVLPYTTEVKSTCLDDDTQGHQLSKVKILNLSCTELVVMSW